MQDLNNNETPLNEQRDNISITIPDQVLVEKIEVANTNGDPKELDDKPQEELPNVLVNINKSSLAVEQSDKKTIPPAKKKKKKKTFDMSEKYQKFKNKYGRVSFYKNNLAYFITIIFYVLIQVFFILLQLLVLYPSANIYLKFARAGGILLDFNCILTMLLVLRRIVTWMRNSIIGRHYPVLDDFLKFHKVGVNFLLSNSIFIIINLQIVKIIGFWILFLSYWHSIAHFLNLCNKNKKFGNL